MKSFLSSLSLTLSLSLWSWGVKSFVEHTNFDSSARPGWVTSKEITGNLLPVSVSGCSSGFPPFDLCVGPTTFHSSAYVVKDNPENWRFFDRTSELGPSTSSKLVHNRPPTQ